MRELKIQSLFGKKGGGLYKRVLAFKKRFPNLLSSNVLSEAGRYILNSPDSFLANHPFLYLCRYFLFWLRLINQPSTAISQKASVKILDVSPLVYGVGVGFPFLEEDEIFLERDIISQIQNLIPAIKSIPGSYFSFHKNKTHFFYLEIKKMKGGFFSSEEKNKLILELPVEFQQGRKAPSSLVLSDNIEDLFKNIQHLSREIRYVKDLPQVMISFIEYSAKTLKFLVIVLRLIKPDTSSVASWSIHLPSFVHLSLEKVCLLDKLRNKYPKEASVFTFEVSRSLFSHSRHDANVRAARHYVAKVLESKLGPFRDYNGGFLNQENEQLQAIKAQLDKVQFPIFPLFEDLFYGIKPITMRVLIPVPVAVNIALLLNKMRAFTPAEPQKYSLESMCSEEANIVMVKTKEKAWKTTLPKSILDHSPSIAFSCLEEGELLYLCFFQKYPKDPFLLDIIQNELLRHDPRQSDEECSILRINFQGGDPPSINPRLAMDIRGHILVNFLFEGLTRIDSRGVPIPAAAEKIEIAPGETSYTFHLRSSCWSNGDEVTAFHFERTWKKAILDLSTQTHPDLFYPIKNVMGVRQNLLSIDDIGVVAKDAKTLCVTLEEPCSYFLNLVATPLYFPLLGESEEPMHFNGAFILAEWEQDRYLSLSQNPYYWDARRNQLGGIKIEMVRDPEEFYHLFQQGELDLIGDPVCPLPLHMLQNHEIHQKLISQDISRVFWIHCNTRQYPLHNARMRKALSFALDREKLANVVFFKQNPHFSPLPPKYSRFQGPLKGDPEEARALFKQALEELGITHDQLPALTLTHSDLSFEKPLINELKAQWKEILGISIQSKELQWNDFSASLDRGDFQLGGLFRRDIFNHPMSYLSFFKKSFDKSPGWENDTFEKLLPHINQKESLEKIERLLINEAPVIPLISQTYFMMLNQARVKGIIWEQNGCFNVREAAIHENNFPHSTTSDPRHTFINKSTGRKKRVY